MKCEKIRNKTLTQRCPNPSIPENKRKVKKNEDKKNRKYEMRGRKATRADYSVHTYLLSVSWLAAYCCCDWPGCRGFRGTFVTLRPADEADDVP